MRRIVKWYDGDKLRAAQNILDGFQDEEEARFHVEGMSKRQFVTFAAEGYEIVADDVRWALKYLNDHGLAFLRK